MESRWPTSRNGSVLFIVVLILPIVLFLAYDKHLQDKIPGLTWKVSASEGSSASASVTPSPVAQNNTGEVSDAALAVTVVTPTPAEPTELQEIVAYIAYKFEPEGKDVVVRAINCFYSESGLRTNAYGENNNGTNDAGVAQINSIHGLSIEERMNYKANIDKAYDIYKGRGDNFSAWYGKLCN